MVDNNKLLMQRILYLFDGDGGLNSSIYLFGNVFMKSNHPSYISWVNSHWGIG